MTRDQLALRDAPTSACAPASAAQRRASSTAAATAASDPSQRTHICQRFASTPSPPAADGESISQADGRSGAESRRAASRRSVSGSSAKMAAVASAAGFGESRRCASAMIPSVPQLPVKSRVRS